MPIAQLDDVDIWYDREGDGGTPVLLIMGLGVPGTAWAHQIPALKRRHRVVFFDNRGVGRSQATPGPYRMAMMANDASRLLDHLGFDAAHVVGVSMGGMIAQELALRSPHQVRTLTLIATHAGGPTAVLPSLKGLALFARANLGASTERRLEVLQRLLFPPAFLATCDRQWLKEVMRRDFGRPAKASVRRAQISAVLHHDTRSRLRQLADLETLIVKAGRDLLVRPAAVDRLHHGIPNSRLLTFREAGHGLIRQCAEPLNQALLDHFANPDRRAPIELPTPAS